MLGYFPEHLVLRKTTSVRVILLQMAQRIMIYTRSKHMD